MSLRMLSFSVIDTFLFPPCCSASRYLYNATARLKTSTFVVPFSSASCSNVAFILSLNSTVSFGMVLSTPWNIHQIYTEYPHCQGSCGVLTVAAATNTAVLGRGHIGSRRP